MVSIISGKDWKGEDCQFYMDENLFRNLEPVKKVVGPGGKDMDIVIIVSGNCGIGKSTFGMSTAKFLDPNFSLKNIAFTSDQFIKLSSEIPKHSAIILDESFASMNSRIGASKEFLKIVNHLQLIRQRNLFIILILPNFFDLSKSIALYRSSFLFVCYGMEFGDRGRFAAFDRDKKKMLYILGQKFMNYQCVKPNFRGRFYKQKAIDEIEYNKLKLEHLQQQQIEKNEELTRREATRSNLAAYMKLILDVPAKKIAEVGGISIKSAYNYINDSKEDILKKYNGTKKEKS